jgi:short-subunit dehydrogenase
MVEIQKIRESNKAIKDLPAGSVAVFIGATSGIGEEGLRQFVQYATAPKIYVVGRKAAAAVPLMNDLKQRNPSAVLEFIEKDASLIRDIDAFCSTIKTKEQKVDFLFLSVGFISFNGRQDKSPRAVQFVFLMSTATLLIPIRNT